MAVKASAETIREMKKQIGQTIKDIERINEGIRSGIRATGSWDDAKAAELLAKGFLAVPRRAQAPVTPVVSAPVTVTTSAVAQADADRAREATSLVGDDGPAASFLTTSLHVRRDLPSGDNFLDRALQPLGVDLVGPDRRGQ